MDFIVAQAIVTTMLLAPAMAALIVFALRVRIDEEDSERSGALRGFEPDWWSETEE